MSRSLSLRKFQHLILSLSTVLGALSITSCHSSSMHVNTNPNGNSSAGLGVQFPTPDQPDGKPVFSGSVGLILQKHCTSCHQGSGGIAPFSLTTFESAARMAGAIKASVTARRMPPPGADNSGSCQTFSNANWLTDQEIATLSQWADGGTPQGDSRITEVKPLPLSQLSEPKQILTMPSAYKPVPPAGALDDYRCFVIDPQVSEDTLITAIQVLPDKTSEVHHVIVFKPTSDKAQQDAEKKLGQDGSPGYTCFGAAGVPSTVVGLWAPGGNASELLDAQAGRKVGLPLEKGRKLIMQVHYNTQNGATPDQSSIAIKYDKAAKPAKWLVVVNFLLELDPGKADIKTEEVQGNSWMQAVNQIFERGLADSFIHGGGLSGVLSPELLGIVLKQPAARDMRVYAFAPHMHTLGYQIELETTSTNANKCVGKVPKFDFHWQGGYNYNTPITIPKTDKFKLTCHFNTSSRTSKISFGEGTNDEMCLAFLLVAD